MSDNHLPTNFQKYIHLSRYSRWIEKENRRETYEETVGRYFDYFENYFRENYNVEYPRKQIEDSVLSLELMPSMRALMTAGKALDRDPMALYNCFSEDTEVITFDGIKRMGDMIPSKEYKILAKDGQWRNATFNKFGIQKLNKVTFRPGTRTNVRFEIKVTPDHTWFTENRGVVTDLKVGDKIASNSTKEEFEFIPEAWIAGFGFGDGTICSGGQAKVRLCGKKNEEFLHIFEEYGHNSICYPPSCDGDAVVIFRLGHFQDWKKIPYNKVNDITWINSWLQGYFDADGHRNPKQPGISSQNHEAIEFVKKYGPMCGYIITGHNILKSLETNFGKRSDNLERLSVRNDTVFYVESIEYYGEEEVYCLTEPVTKSFTLSQGILTGNCSFVAVDRTTVFDEIMYILMLGCFSPETLVKTKTGEKRIDDITTEDEVLTFNFETKQYEFENPVAVSPSLTSSEENKIELEFEDGVTVQCTEDHEFYTKNRGWVKAKDLTEEDDIQNYNEI